MKVLSFKALPLHTISNTANYSLGIMCDFINMVIIPKNSFEASHNILTVSPRNLQNVSKVLMYLITLSNVFEALRDYFLRHSHTLTQ